MSNYADWSNNFGNIYTPYLESDNEEGDATTSSKQCSSDCRCSKHTESFSNMSCSKNCKINNCSCNKTIKRTQLNPTINELDAMYTNIMPPLHIETFENVNASSSSNESFKNMGSKLVETTPSNTLIPDMSLNNENTSVPINNTVVPDNNTIVPNMIPTDKMIESFENSNLAPMSPSSMMMGLTRPMVNSKENFSNTFMDMGIQIQKKEPNMNMTYSNNTPSMMTPPPLGKKYKK
jgi:hypothetical protein